MKGHHWVIRRGGRKGTEIQFLKELAGLFGGETCRESEGPEFASQQGGGRFRSRRGKVTVKVV